MNPVVRALVNLDRRWIFLLIAIAVMIPILRDWKFPEIATAPVKKAFDLVEKLPPNSKVLCAFDFDASSAPELQPMANSWLWHCAKKGHRVYIMTLWATGQGYLPEKNKAILSRFPEYQDANYGKTWVYLGFRAGNEVVIRSLTNNFKSTFTTDNAGTNTSEIPMMNEIQSVSDFNLILNASAGYPGTKEWVQYAATPFNLSIAAGNTGVQAAQMFPYYPNQLHGLLAAVKGAAEYEALLSAKYPDYAGPPDKPNAALLTATKTMGPQLLAHIVILALIILGNIVLALQRTSAQEAA